MTVSYFKYYFIISQKVFRNAKLFVIHLLIVGCFLFFSKRANAQHTAPVKSILSSEQFLELNGGLDNTFYLLKNNHNITVAFLGGSITHNPGWRDKICEYLIQKYPQVSFRFISAGIPSLGSLPHAFRLQTDVLTKGKIDLLFLEAAVNDYANGTDSLTQIRSMEGIVRHALQVNPSMNIVLMAFADEHKNLAFANSAEPLEVKVHREVAAYYELPFLNIAKEVYERIANKEFTWENDFKNLHPSPFGQNIYYQSIKNLFQVAEKEYAGDHSADYVLPKPLDQESYSNGAYASIYLATKLQGFSIAEKWNPADKIATRAGFVNVPVLGATDAGSSFSLSFIGTAVGIAIVSGPDAGVIEYRIDNSEFRTLQLFTKSSKFLHLPSYFILSDGLTAGAHELEVKISAMKGSGGGNACRIVHFLVNK